MIPRKVVEICSNAFYDCQRLNSIEFHNNSELQFIGENSFNKTLISSVIFPSHVTKICYSSFSQCIKSVDLSNNKELKTICSGAFVNSSIENLTILSTVNLEEGWCNGTPNLNNIKIIENNKEQSVLYYYENKLIFGKSNPKSETFDILLFSRRDLKEILIPSNVKIISSYAFEDCKNLEKVNFLPNSELMIIGKNAFHESSIEQIKIPSHVTRICSKAFEKCSIKRVYFDINSELKIIGKYAFSDSAIESIEIPKNVTEIKEFAFAYLNNIKNITFEENSQMKFIDENAFSFSSIANIKMPDNVAKISNSLFFNCVELESVEFTPQSKLQKIGKSAFNGSSIKRLIIPSCCYNFNKLWNYNAKDLNFLTIIPTGEENIANFNDTFIVSKIDLKSDKFDAILFVNKSLNNVTIPSHIKQIEPFSFSYSKIKTVEFPINSEIETICDSAFSDSLLETITIPRCIVKIGDEAFCGSKELKRFGFENDSMLTSIGSFAFENSIIGSFFIPKNVTAINKFVFYKCIKLQIIEIEENAKLNLFNLNYLINSDLIIMVPPYVIHRIEFIQTEQ